MLTIEQRLDRYMDILEQSRIDAQRRREQHDEEMRQLRIELEQERKNREKALAEAEARRLAAEIKRIADEAKWREEQEKAEAKRLAAETKRIADEAKRREEQEKAEAKRREEQEKAEAKQREERAKAAAEAEARWNEEREKIEARQLAAKEKADAEYQKWRDEYDKKAAQEYAEIRALQRKSEGMFISKWGKLVEALVNNQLVPLLRARGIMVGDTTQRRSGCHEGVSYEFDIIAINGDTIVIVEVKTTLVPADVKDFVEKLKHVRVWLPEYANKNIFGAVAYLHCDSNADRVAEKSGLFTILATGSSAKILNPMDFLPRNY